MSLFRGYFVGVGVDATGTEKVEMVFGAFTPGRLGKWLPEPVPGSPWFFKTDERGFGGGTFRVFASFSFETEKIGNIDAKNANGVLGSDPSTPRKWVDIKWLPIPNGSWRYQTATSEPKGVVASKNTAICETKVVMEATGNYPFAPRANLAMAAVDFRVTIVLSIPQHGVVKFDLAGWHDAFPDYEWIVSVGPKQIAVDPSGGQNVGSPLLYNPYQFSTNAKGPSLSPSSLGPGGNITVNNSLSVNGLNTPNNCFSNGSDPNVDDGYTQGLP